MSRSWAEIDVAAISRNAATIRRHAPGAELCAVVKANGYGHGAIRAATAALAGGATRLAVAQVDEGAALRQAGIDAPIWVLSEPEPHEFVAAAGFDLEPALYSRRGIEAAADIGRVQSLTVHVKVDTGMNRVGARPDDAAELVTTIAKLSGVELGSVFTHLAVADEPANPFTATQLRLFDDVLDAIDRVGVEVPLVHAANSGATIAFPESHHDVVRCGIALYGLPPSDELDGWIHLEPALSWLTRVSFVKRLDPGARVSYGLRREVDTAVTAATIPVGYADGYRRGLWTQGRVLVGGRARPILGVVTMDQLVVDCGDDDVVAGDEAVLIGSQGEATVTASDVARWSDTINYEVVCAIAKRVERIDR